MWLASNMFLVHGVQIYLCTKEGIAEEAKYGLISSMGLFELRKSLQYCWLSKTLMETLQLSVSYMTTKIKKKSLLM